jgi:glycosyltransferase involved in cell wall biosynthesis
MMETLNICILGDARSIHVQRIARGLAGRQVRTTVVTHHPVAIENVEVRKYDVPPASLRYPARWARRRDLVLKEIMRTHDIVQIHYLHDWGFTEEIAAEGCLVVTPWGSDIQLPPEVPPPPPELVTKRIALLRMANVVLATCPTFADTIATFAGIRRDKVRIAPKGVDTALFRPSGTWPPRESVVGFFKGFRLVNGARYLIEAIPAVRESCPDVRFDFVGSGPLLADCRQVAEQFGVADAIRWLPPQPHECMPAVMAEWSVAAIPSLMEAFCIGALESAAMGLPVVASRVGGLVETVRDGLTGILVPPADPWHLAGGLIELLEDRERGGLMGRAGRRVVCEEYEWSQSLDAMLAGYAWALNTRAVPAGK